MVETMFFIWIFSVFLLIIPIGVITTEYEDENPWVNWLTPIMFLPIINTLLLTIFLLYVILLLLKQLYNVPMYFRNTMIQIMLFNGIHCSARS